MLGASKKMKPSLFCDALMDSEDRAETEAKKEDGDIGLDIAVDNKSPVVVAGSRGSLYVWNSSWSLLRRVAAS